jgi:hypothetical protein
MYSSNLRSFLRTTIRQVLCDWTGEKEPVAIAHHVLDVVLVDFDFTKEHFQEALYRVIYEETCDILKKPRAQAETPDAAQLELEGVPKRQAKIIAQIERENIYVPSKRAYLALYGKQRLSRAELAESVEHYRTEARQNARIAELLARLLDLPGYYE